MDGDNWAKIIETMLTLVGTIFVAVMSYKSSRESKRGADVSSSTREEIAQLKEEIAEIKEEAIGTRKELAVNNLKTSQISFRQALEHSRDDIPAILELASEYFLDMGGNADMGRKFLYWVDEYKVLDWAARHQLDITPLIEAAKHKR